MNNDALSVKTTKIPEEEMVDEDVDNKSIAKLCLMDIDRQAEVKHSNSTNKIARPNRPDEPQQLDEKLKTTTKITKTRMRICSRQDPMDTITVHSIEDQTCTKARSLLSLDSRITIR